MIRTTNACTTAGQIAGGIDVSDDVIVCGGKERVVGENTNWNLRDKLIQLKYAENSDERALLRIVGLKLPISFNSTIAYFDDGKDMPEKKVKQVTSEINSKAITVLKERIDMAIPAQIKMLVNSNNLIAPLYWVLGEMIRLLAFVNRKKKPDSRRIKISPEMSQTIESIWNGKGFFKYYPYTDDVPQNLFELILHMLDIIEKNRPPKGKWKKPYLGRTRYPTLTDSLKKSMEAKMSREKMDLTKRIKGKKGLDLIKEYVLTVIKMEKILSSHVNDIEQYYVRVSKNMSKIHNSLKNFFSRR